MKAMNKFLLVTLILFMVSLGCVSAADNTTTTTQDHATLSNDVTNNTITTTSEIKTDTDLNILKTVKSSNDETSEKSIKKDSMISLVTTDNYEQYFRKNTTTNQTETTELVESGDTLNLQGTFQNVNFTIDKTNLTITSLDKNVQLYNCTVNIQGSNAKGATVSNLTINNTNWYGSGIYVNKTTDITVTNNTIHVSGPFGFALAADEMNTSLIIDNYFETSCRSDMNRTHTAAAFGLCYYNNIINNTVVSDQANGIYFSIYGSGLFRGGACDYNNVTGNVVSGGDTSWSYTIQIMGKGNNITNNSVKNGYRGISTQDYTDNVIRFNDVNATSQGIYACEGASVYNNTVHVSADTAGIETGGNNVLIENNTIYTYQGAGIIVSSSYVTIKSNVISSTAGNGIYSKGKYTYVTIVSNEIESGKIGILIKQQSSTRKVNYINITNNKVTSLSADYAIDLYEAGSRDPDDAVIYVSESNVLSCKNGIGLNISYRPPATAAELNTPESNKTYTITNSNYYQYFDEEFRLNTNKVLKNDTIILNGTFTNKDFIIPIKLHIIGNNCYIYNGSITLCEDANAADISNVIIRNNETNNVINRHAIEINEVNNCKVTNVNIISYDKWESFGIFLYSSSGNTITNNYIRTSGDYVNFALFLYSSDMNTIENNDIRINQSNVPIEYLDEIMFSNTNIGTVKEILHDYGILLMYSSTNIINNNTVKSTSMFTEYTFPTLDCKNSLVGIDIYYDSNNNKVTNNTVSIASYGPYTYGMGVLGAPWGTSITTLNATNNSFIQNNVSVTGGYFTTGFIAGLNSINTIVYNNTFYLKGSHNSTALGDYVYGITLEACQNSTISKNNIKAYGAAVYGIEAFDTTYNTVDSNVIVVSASYPYGIAGYRASYNNFTQNKMSINEKNYGDATSSIVTQATHTDAIPYGKAGILLMTNSFNNTITGNTIDTNVNKTVNLTYQAINNTVTQNALTANVDYGDASVQNDHKTNIVSNNFIYFTTVKVTPFNSTIGKTVTLTAKVSSKASDMSNLSATFKFGSQIVDTVKVINGTASVNFTIPTSWRATTYLINVNVSGINFQNNTGTANANISRPLTETIVTVKQVLGQPGDNVTISAEVKDIYGNDVNGKASFKINGVTIGTANVTLGKTSLNYTIPLTFSYKKYNITVKYSGDNLYASSNGSAILGVQEEVVGTVNSAVAIIGHQVNFTAKFTHNGIAVKSGKVAMKINGLTIAYANISNGIAKFIYNLPTKYNSRNYTMSFVYGGSTLLSAARLTSTLELLKYNTTILYNTTTAKVGNNVTLTMRVCNTTKQYYAVSGKVGIKINGITVKDSSGQAIITSIKNGTANFVLTATKALTGNNNITFTYGGNTQFVPYRATFKNGLIITA